MVAVPELVPLPVNSMKASGHLQRCGRCGVAEVKQKQTCHMVILTTHRPCHIIKYPLESGVAPGGQQTARLQEPDGKVR